MILPDSHLPDYVGVCPMHGAVEEIDAYEREYVERCLNCDSTLVLYKRIADSESGSEAPE